MNTVNEEYSYPPMAIGTTIIGYPADQVEIIKTKKYIKCEYCRRRNQIDAEFCAGCGAPCYSSEGI